MNDTVKRLMGLADEYMTCEREGSDGWPARQALEAELLRLFTPVPSDEVTDHIRSMDLDLREDMCAFSFRSGVCWAENQHGIGCG